MESLALEESFEISRSERKKLLRQATARLKEKESAATDLQTIKLDTFTTPDAHIARLPPQKLESLPKPYVGSKTGVAHIDPRRMLADQERAKSGQVRKIEDPVKINEGKTKEKEATAGADWFNLPKTDLTPELKRDLQLLKMRGVLDPKRFYKKESSKNAAPPFSQVGTIIAGPTEYYSARLPNKQRKRTLVEEILEQEKSNGGFKRKYNEIQDKKTSGRKAFYRKLKEKRSKHSS